MASCSLAADMRRDAAILPGDMVPAILHQCSRSTPAAGEGTWQPGWSDIEKLEAALPAALAADAQGRELADQHPPAGWRRQYVGIVRNGDRFIYGNFYPANAGLPMSGLGQPVIICDGGPSFFGVEYDLKAGRISHLAFNGRV